MERAIIEAVLFLENEPLEIKKIAQITKLPVEAVRQAITAIQNVYNQDDHGIELIKLSDGYCFLPKKELWGFLKDRYGKRNERKLSRAAFETLAIIAYSQPVTRAEVESIRGVAADNMIKLLLTHNLIKEVGKKDIPGKPIQYGTSKEFLRIFQLASIADLPKLEDTEQERFDQYD